MAFLILSILFFCMVALYVAEVYFDARPPFAKKKKSVDEPKNPQISPQEEFLNKIKETLPRDKGFIYELSTSIDYHDDLIVKVRVIDPVEDKQLTTMSFDSLYGSAGVTNTIDRSMMNLYKRQEIKRLAGQTEIIS